MMIEQMQCPCVHVMPKEKFTYGFIEFTFEAFPDKGIAFIVYGNDGAQGYAPYIDQRVVAVDSAREVFRCEKAAVLLDAAEAIVFNWVNMSMLPSMQRYLPKTYLLFWGGDFTPYCNAKGLGLSEHLKRLLLIHSIRRARGVMALLPSDLDKIRQLAHFQKESYRVDIVGTPRFTLAGVKEELARGRSPLKVLVGNSATPSNRHIAALELLSRFANEDVVVYAPLSYGDEHYREEVIACGRRCLGDKFVPLLDYMDPAEYTSFLSGISVGVFNHDRQQGMGNISKLLRMGSKVYVSSESGMLEDLQATGSVVHLTPSIADSTFAEFSEIDVAEVEQNKTANSAERCYRRAVAHWRAFYDRGVEKAVPDGR